MVPEVFKLGSQYLKTLSDDVMLPYKSVHIGALLMTLGAVGVNAVASNSTIQWGNCSIEAIGYPAPKLQCAELIVPLNWTEPKGETIIIGLTRVLANSTKDRIGSLIMNPGGPGVATSQLIAGQAVGYPLFPKEVSDVFDIIGFDPRGIGLSTPVMCDPDLWNQRNTYFPTSEKEYDAMVALNKAQWESCANLTGPLLYNVDTLSVVKDIEALRIALGDEKLNFLGVSYGTQMGLQYAQLYPNNYRVIALDALVNHNKSNTDLFANEASAYETSFGRFASWCSNTTNCTLHGKDVESLFTTLVNNATKTPIPAPGCDGTTCYANITGEEILFTTQQQLLFKEGFATQGNGWAELSEMLSAAIGGNATALASAYASQQLAQSNTSSIFAGQAVGCLDFVYDDLNTYEKLKYRLQLGAVVAPITRGASQTYSTQTQCLGFPHRPTNPQTDQTVMNNGSTPILLSSSSFDPSCNFLWTEDALFQTNSSVMVERNGDGHTSFFLGGETSKVIVDYLVNEKVPEPNLVVDT